MAIDRVTYILKNIKVGLSEVEVEAKSPKGLATVQDITDALISKYHPNLRQWFHGKFVTGLAIRKLLETKQFHSYILKGELRSEAFELIERTIRSERF